MSYTKTKLHFQLLLATSTTHFTILAKMGTDVDQFEIDQLHKFVDQFASQVTISDSQGE